VCDKMFIKIRSQLSRDMSQLSKNIISRDVE